MSGQPKLNAQRSSLDGQPTPPWRTAVVTGASSGIGEALAIELARRGVSVGLLARRETVLHDLSRRLAEAAPGACFPVQAADVTDEHALSAALDRLWDHLDGWRRSRSQPADNAPVTS